MESFSTSLTVHFKVEGSEPLGLDEATDPLGLNEVTDPLGMVSNTSFITKPIPPLDLEVSVPPAAGTV